jgi:hypothetical protein
VIPTDDPRDAMCGCPRFMATAAEAERQELGAPDVASLTEVLGEDGPVSPQDGSGRATDPEVANG